MTMETAIGGLDELRDALADDAAFERWYERTLPRVYAYLAARTGDVDLAEELTQQAFIAAIDGRRRFDGRADTVTWVCAIARNKLADHFRRLEREERRTARATVRALETEPPDSWRAVEEREVIRAALDRLPATQRAVLIFVDMDDLSVPEAARLIGKSVGATQSLLARARATFRASYTREVRDA